MKRKQLAISILFIGFVLIMIAVDVAGGFSYWSRSAIKVTMFGIIPGFFLGSKQSLKTLFSKGKYLKYVVIFSLLIVGIVIGGYFILNQFGVFETVSTSLTNQVGVTLANYPYVFVYVILLNGPLEEFYFRFIMMDVDLFSSKTVQAVFSSFLFAIYHVGMLFTMFSFYLFILAILGLMLVGFVFIKINEHNEGILYSTILHMAANVGINIVGAIILFS
jgi:membrane protease YdiL (CAAX protease family)